MIMYYNVVTVTVRWMSHFLFVIIKLWTFMHTNFTKKRMTHTHIKYAEKICTICQQYVQCKVIYRILFTIQCLIIDI